MFRTASEIAIWAEANDITSDDLDDMVHDTASRTASAVNNGGLEAQIVYLEILSVEELRRHLGMT